VISATQPQAGGENASGEFREDLYYRLNVVKLYIPALAERREDIRCWPTTFLTRLAIATEGASWPFPSGDATACRGPCPATMRQLLNVWSRRWRCAATEVIPDSLIRQAIDAGDTTLTPLDEAERPSSATTW